MFHLPFILDEPHEFIYASAIVVLAGFSWNLWRQRQLERKRKEFVLRVSHELRTPLTVIKSAAEILHDPKLNHLSNKRREGLIVSLVKAVGRLEKTVEKLSDESKFVLKG